MREIYKLFERRGNFVALSLISYFALLCVFFSLFLGCSLYQTAVDTIDTKIEVEKLKAKKEMIETQGVLLDEVSKYQKEIVELKSTQRSKDRSHPQRVSNSVKDLRRSPKPDEPIDQQCLRLRRGKNLRGRLVCRPQTR